MLLSGLMLIFCVTDISAELVGEAFVTFLWNWNSINRAKDTEMIQKFLVII